MEEITKSFEYSLVAFNGSSNCDRTSPQNFYDSYIRRKEGLIRNRLRALSNGALINRDKLKKDIEYLKEAKENKQPAVQFLETLLSMTANKDDLELIQQARDVLT